MINTIILGALRHRGLVLLASLVLAISGLWAIKQTPIDAIPDLSDVQVIVKASYPGQSPQVVQDQITYPLTTALSGVPGATTVRGFSFFGDAYVYIIFAEDTDPYWARSRVLEVLSQTESALPSGVSATLGPDATGVGWIYVYALQDPTGQHNLADLRALQDWFLTFELQSVPGVAEVASVGGMIKQHTITINPDLLPHYGITIDDIQRAIQRNNGSVGGGLIEMAEAEYIVQSFGDITDRQALSQIVIKTQPAGRSLHLGDIATITESPAPRRGVAELNGEGEAVGGIVVMRGDANAKATITRVKQRLADIQSSLPAGVELVTVYDRSKIIEGSIETLGTVLLEEFLIVALVCAVFLFHFRSALVAIISIPLGLLGAFLIMQWQGVPANIMSLGGLAIAIGAMVDGAIVVVENVYKHQTEGDDAPRDHWDSVGAACTEVGPALFFSLLIITVSFLPVFALEAQEGKLFSPLAATKTYAMAVSALLAITVVPVLAGYLVRIKRRSNPYNPVDAGLKCAYRPILRRALEHPKLTAGVSALLVIVTLVPLSQLKTEFMPDMFEGDLMYMPTTLPGISIDKARELLQQSHKLIKSVPEVERVFGKAGRADTATDPAPLTMIESFITLKPKEQWRDGLTLDQLQQELDNLLRFPGVSNAWVMPIKTRIDMLATGVKTPLALRVSADNLDTLAEVSSQLETALMALPGARSVYAERPSAARYITLTPDRQALANYGIDLDAVQTLISLGVGGMAVDETIEGSGRFPIALRFEQSTRQSPESLAKLPVSLPDGGYITLGDIAAITITDGPAVIKTENSRLSSWVLIELTGSSVDDFTALANERIASSVALPPGVTLTWTGQFEHLQRAKEKLTLILPLTLAVMALLLYLHFRRWREIAVLIGTLPVALTGGFWLMLLLGQRLSIASAVGFIALLGIAIETGVLMLMYLGATQSRYTDSEGHAEAEPKNAAVLDIEVAACSRLRPIIMTAAAVILGLLPVMINTGIGSEVMQRIAAPMLGGMVTTLLTTLVLLPVVYRHAADRAP